MSAIKLNILKIFFSILLLLTLLFCTQNESAKKTSSANHEEITFIELSHVGGELGSYSNLKITKDSIHFERGMSANKTHNEWHNKISTKDWKNLTSSFKIKDFNSIESSPSIQPIDGMDETFQIKTTKSSHVFVNAYSDKHYRQFEEFKIKLQNIIPKKHQ